MCGSVLAVLILLTVWDEDVLNVEHVLTIVTVLGAAVAGARVFIPGAGHRGGDQFTVSNTTVILNSRIWRLCHALPDETR